MSKHEAQPDSPEEYLRRLQEAAAAADQAPTAPHPVMPPPGAPPGYYPAMPAPEHPSATTSLVLGVVGLTSVVVLAGLGLLLSPIAWLMGSRAVKEIDAHPGRYSGRDRANAGRITGIIGTVLLVVGLVGLALVFTLLFMPAPSPEIVNPGDNV